MDYRDIGSYSTLLILVAVISVDCALLHRFRTYYRSHGYGVVTCALINLAAAQLVVPFLYTTGAVLTFIFEHGDKKLTSIITFFNDTGTAWAMSVTLVHVIVLTCLRIYSVSYGNRFLNFVHSSFNIHLVLLKMWFVSLAITIAAISSTTLATDNVFYTGLLTTGSLAVMTFFCTTERYSSSNTLHLPSLPRDQNIDGVRNPQKIFVVFSGIVVLFVIFILPVCILNLYFNFQKKVLDEQIALLISLWLSLSVLANSVWIWYRLRCTMNHVTSFYSRWTLEEHNNNACGESQPYTDDGSESQLPKRHSFRSCDAFKEQHLSNLSLGEQIRKDRL